MELGSSFSSWLQMPYLLHWFLYVGSSHPPGLNSTPSHPPLPTTPHKNAKPTSIALPLSPEVVAPVRSVGESSCGSTLLQIHGSHGTPAEQTPGKVAQLPECDAGPVDAGVTTQFTQVCVSGWLFLKTCLLYVACKTMEQAIERQCACMLPLLLCWICWLSTYVHACAMTHELSSCGLWMPV